MGYQWISQTCHEVHCTENCRHDISAIVCQLSDFPVNIFDFDFFSPNVFSVRFLEIQTLTVKFL